MKIITVNQDGTLQIPVNVLAELSKSQRWVLVPTQHTLFLKPILDYDLESDELDLLIDVEAPVPAEVVPLDAGVYIRRERRSGRVVGVFVRGYSHLIRQLHAGG